MRIEVLNTGTELLLGSVLNTHVKYLAEALFPLGLRIQRQATVPDGMAIRDALLEAFPRTDAILITGGLGPTSDDITREITAELLGLELVHDEEILQAITKRFRSRNLKMSPRVARQAQRPREAILLPNDNGTAPGLYLPAQESPETPHLFLLPGPPRELKPMFERFVAPILEALRPSGEVTVMRNYRVSGVGESLVEERIGAELLALGIELGYCARPAEVDVRIIGSPSQVADAEAIVLRAFQRQIVSADSRALEKVVVDMLSAARATVAVAESCTGGALAHRLTNVPGASGVFLAGYITYANSAKTSALGVAADRIQDHGAVSPEVAASMAEGALRASGADWALSTTGIAGPGGGTDAKPVGTVHIGLAGKTMATQVATYRFPADRATFKDLTTQTALDLLRQALVPVHLPGSA